MCPQAKQVKMIIAVSEMKNMVSDNSWHMIVIIYLSDVDNINETNANNSWHLTTETLTEFPHWAKEFDFFHLAPELLISYCRLDFVHV